MVNAVAQDRKGDYEPEMTHRGVLDPKVPLAGWSLDVPYSIVASKKFGGPAKELSAVVNSEEEMRELGLDFGVSADFREKTYLVRSLGSLEHSAFRIGVDSIYVRNDDRNSIMARLTLNELGIDNVNSSPYIVLAIPKTNKDIAMVWYN